MKLFKNNIIIDNLWCANDNYQLSGDNIIKSSMSMMHNYKWKCYRMEVNVIKVWIELFSWEGQGSNFLPSKIIYFWIQTALHWGSTIEIMNLNFLSWTKLNERHFFPNPNVLLLSNILWYQFMNSYQVAARNSEQNWY